MQGGPPPMQGGPPPPMGMGMGMGGYQSGPPPPGYGPMYAPGPPPPAPYGAPMYAPAPPPPQPAPAPAPAQQPRFARVWVCGGWGLTASTAASSGTLETRWRMPPRAARGGQCVTLCGKCVQMAWLTRRWVQLGADVVNRIF
jgi:hypothetical protein